MMAENYFTEGNEIVKTEPQLMNSDAKKTRQGQYEDITIDPYTIDTVDKYGTTDKLKFIETLKSSLNNKEI
jgi:hypothetical protein